MLPLTSAAIGWILVALDFEVGRVDVVPDTVGWALVVLGLAALRGERRWVRAWYAAIAGLVVAAVTLVARLVVGDLGLGAAVTLALVGALVEIAAVYLLLTALVETYAGSGRADAEQRFRTLRRVSVGVLVIYLVVALALPVLILPAALAMIGVYVWLIVELFGHSDDPEVRPAGRPGASV